MINLIRQIFAALGLGPNTVMQNVYPRSVDGVAAVAITLAAAAVAWTFGAYVQIVAATAANARLTGFTLENFVGAVSQGEIEIATGLLAAEVVIARAQVTNGSIVWPEGRYIPAGTRLSARYRTSTGAADTVDIKANVTDL